MTGLSWRPKEHDEYVVQEKEMIRVLVNINLIESQIRLTGHCIGQIPKPALFLHYPDKYFLNSINWDSSDCHLANLFPKFRETL
jgi:hypothetical protein